MDGVVRNVHGPRKAFAVRESNLRVDRKHTSLFMDLDMTLRRDNAPVDRAMARRAVLLGNMLYGGRMGIASGSDINSVSKNFANPIIEQMRTTRLFPKMFMIVNNGGSVYAIEKGEIRHLYDETPLSAWEKEKIAYAVVKKTRLEMANGLLRREPKMYDRGTNVAIALLPGASPEERNAFDSDGSYREALMASLRLMLPQNLTVEKTGKTTITVRNHVDKLYAIEKLAGMNNWDLGFMIYLGDEMHPGGNDYPMVIGSEKHGIQSVEVNSPEDTRRIMAVIMGIQRYLDRIDDFKHNAR